MVAELLRGAGAVFGGRAGPWGAAAGAVVGGLLVGLGVVTVAQIMGADDEAENTLSSDTSAADACSTCESPPEQDPQDDEPSEQDAKDAKRMKPQKLEEAARNNGYRDAHHMKRELGLDSRYDIFADRQGRMYAGPRQGSGTPQYLNMNTRGVY